MKKHSDMIMAPHGQSMNQIRRYVVRGSLPPEAEMFPIDAGPQPRNIARRRKRFHWKLICVILTMAALAWFMSGVKAALTWNQILWLLDIHDRERFTRLFVLGVIVTALCAILRVLRRR